MKNVRRIIQWCFFALFSAAFLPLFSDNLKLLIHPVINLQFFPALISAPLISAVIIILTFVFGRIYCSSVCPFSTVQDIFIGRKKKYNYSRLKITVRYFMPIASFFLLIAGFPSLASMADSYSLSGRIMLAFNRIIIMPLIRLISLIFRQFSVYLPEWELQFNYLPFVFTVPVFVLIILMIRKRGRLYCNTLCPVGALLSIPAKYSLFAVRIIKENCTECGACEKVCKAEAASSSSRYIDQSKCISCFNCLSVCRFNALEYGKKNSRGEKSFNKKENREKRSSKENHSEVKDLLKKRDFPGRRDFLKKTAAGSVILLSSLLIKNRKNMIPLSDNASAIPPGSESRVNLMSKCVSCSLCINNCPSGVLQPAVFTQLGVSGFGVPYLDYNKGFCSYSCKTCSDVCPTGAIRRLDIEKKKLIKIGEAHFERKFCIVETDKTSCGACAEICPTGAIDLIHIGDSDSGPLEIPLISSIYCIGCGACQYVCPVEDKNAIFVNPFSVHETAEVIAEKTEMPEPDSDSGFAF